MSKMLFAALLAAGSLSFQAQALDFAGLKEAVTQKASAALSSACAPATGSMGQVEAAFSPGGAQSLVIREIGAATSSIDMAAYSFTSAPIAKALVAAHRRGVRVRAVLDKSQLAERYTGGTFLVNAGIEVRIDSRYAIMHNKFMVIDGQTVQTGSFNYTKSAQDRNAENVLVLRGSPGIVRAYSAEWSRLWAESAPLAARE